MTKLNHSRPYLKHIDNLRRELQREARRTDTLSFGKSAKKSESVNAKLLLHLLDAMSACSQAQLDALTILAKKGSSKKKDLSSAIVKKNLAQESLSNAATKVAALMVIEQINGKSEMQKAYSDFAEKIRKVDELLFEDLNEFVMTDAFERVCHAIDRAALAKKS